ncbi:MAG: SDR family oxidoreductase [Pirellulales bacterium]|nr:SDR family oxidoreductase [Pirellulales bacterium]
MTVLTGAASGIGRHLSGRLARLGDRLLATDVDLASLEWAATQDAWPTDRVQLAALDVRDPVAWKQTIDHAVADWGRLDVLANVAGVIVPGLVHEQTPQDVDLHLDINAKGVIYGSQAAAAVMVAQRSGQIVNVGSMAALAAVPGLGLYTASKWAVRGFSLAVAQELAPHGVRVSLICPDAVATPMLDKQLDYQEAALTFSGRRFLSVEEVGRAIVEQAIERGRLEVTIPWSRAFLSKLTSCFPALAAKALPALTAKGLRQQRAARERLRPHEPT